MFKNISRKAAKGGSFSPSGDIHAPKPLRKPEKPRYVAEQPELYAFDNPYEKQNQSKKSRGSKK